MQHILQDGLDISLVDWPLRLLVLNRLDFLLGHMKELLYYWSVDSTEDSESRCCSRSVYRWHNKSLSRCASHRLRLCYSVAVYHIQHLFRVFFLMLKNAFVQFKVSLLLCLFRIYSLIGIPQLKNLLLLRRDYDYRFRSKYFSSCWLPSLLLFYKDCFETPYECSEILLKLILLVYDFIN